MTLQQFAFTSIRFLGATLDLIPDEMTWRGMPKDVVPFQDFVPAQNDLGRFREWAMHENMISDQSQLMTDEAVVEISKNFTRDDNLSVAVHVTPKGHGLLRYNYLEYPFVPTSVLVKKQLTIRLVYWSMEPDSRRLGPHSDHNGVRFGFWLPDSYIEFASVSYSKAIAQKFEALLDELATTYPLELLGGAGKTNNETEITVNGDVRARFFRTGMAHDMVCTVISDPLLKNSNHRRMWKRMPSDCTEEPKHV